MPKHTGKRVALNKLTLTKRAVEAMEPADKPWIAWDDKLTGFGIQVHPSGIKSGNVPPTVEIRSAGIAG